MPDRTVGKYAATGAAKGAGAGAAIGTLIAPGPGTAIGAGVGAIVGGIAGRQKGKDVREIKEKEQEALDYQKALADKQRAREAEIQSQLKAEGDQRLQKAQEVTALAQRFYREGLPEQVRTLAEENIQQNQAQQLSSAASLGASLRGAGTIAQSTANSYRQLNAADAQASINAREGYTDALTAEGVIRGGNQDRLITEAQALKGASIRNDMAALNAERMIAIANAEENARLMSESAQALTGTVGTFAGAGAFDSIGKGNSGGSGGSYRMDIPAQQQMSAFTPGYVQANPTMTDPTLNYNPPQSLQQNYSPFGESQSIFQ